MGRAEKIAVTGVGVLYVGLLVLLFKIGHGPAAVLFFLIIVVKASVFFGGIRKLVTTQGVPKRKPVMSPTALLVGPIS